MIRIGILILALFVAQAATSSFGAAESTEAIAETETGAVRMINLYVLYPQPEDSDVFDLEYQGHAKLIKEKTGRPFIVSRILENDQDTPGFYQMFTMSFSSMEDLDSILTPAVRKELDADAFRISSGGPPLIMVSEMERYD